ncbi:MAG: hypothetical protein JEZ12_25560 [Desulfobacterium sp.]|nr:hypothetical protein [Desulfobacterium sp.]
MAKAKISIETVDGQLVVSAHVGTMIQAFKWCSNYMTQFDEHEYTIDETVFAREIMGELLSEEEDGTTLIHEMFDKAAARAIENGCEGVEFTTAEGMMDNAIPSAVVVIKPENDKE